MRLYVKVATKLKEIQEAALAQDFVSAGEKRESVSKLLNSYCPWWDDVLNVDLIFEDSTLNSLVLKVMIQEENTNKCDTYFIEAYASLIQTLEVRCLDTLESDDENHADFIDYLEEAIYSFLTQKVTP